MKNNEIQHYHFLENLFFQSNFTIESFKQAIENFESNNKNQGKNQKNIILSAIDLLIIQENFYEIFQNSRIAQPQLISNESNCNIFLQFGFEVVQYLFSRRQLFENDTLLLNSVLKKCNFDLFLLITMCQGQLLNSLIRRDKVKAFFIQNFKKNNTKFLGIQRFSQFHQNLVQKSSYANQYLFDRARKINYFTKIKCFLNFYSQNKDFFPATLQIGNLLFKILMSIKLDTKDDNQIYGRIQSQFFAENSYHFVTTCKNIRFLIQFFRNPFNQKNSQFYPQKAFVKLLAKYCGDEIVKIISFSQVGLTWNDQQISSCFNNIIKLGLTQINLTLLKCFLGLWLRNGLNDSVLKIIQGYIPKIFIFLKHEKLFDISLCFLQEFCLGPKFPTVGIMNKLLQKLISFSQKECPLSKAKFQKIATLQDKMYIQLKNLIKKQSQNKNLQILKDQIVQEKLKFYEWQEIKVSLFSSNSNTNSNTNMLEKEAGEYRGLYNIGNSCYMNSFIQCLYMTIQFRKRILNESTLALEKDIIKKLHQQKDNKAENDKVNQLSMARQHVRPTAQLQRLFAQLTKSRRPAINPINIKNVSSPQFKNSFQQDTIQFGRSFLDIISRSSIENIFQGQQTNQIICPSCQKSRFKKQNFMDLMLNEIIQQNDDLRVSNTSKQLQSGSNIQKMVVKCFQTQKIEGLLCDFCNIKSEISIKQHSISKHPNYLILTLKRFQYDIKQNRNIKKHYSVDLKQQEISVQGQKYLLYGLIVHRGQNANSGHYFSFCREWKSELKFNQKQSYSQETFKNKEQKIEQKQKEAQKQKIQQKTEQKILDESQQIRVQKMEIELQSKIQQFQPESNLIMNSQIKFVQQKANRWLCLNDSIVTAFESFQNVKQFLDLNQQDTPYILFFQKASHINSQKCQYLKQPINLREPLQKFIQKDNNQYLKQLESKKGNQNSQKVNWKNFGKVKGFTAYDYFKFTKKDDDEQNNGYGGGGFGNMPIL